MSSFTLPLILSPVGVNWQTERPFDYEIGLKGSGLLITVPPQFTTDLGTIPAAARVLINPADARCAAAFVLHDYLCSWQGFSRTVADAVLYEGLMALGTPRWKALLIYIGVSIYRMAVLAKD